MQLFIALLLCLVLLIGFSGGFVTACNLSDREKEAMREELERYRHNIENTDIHG